MWITSYSKIWRNEKVVEVRKTRAKNNKSLSGDNNLSNELKQAQNSYYYTIRKAKQIF